MEEKRYMEAAGAFRNALDLNPNELEIYYYLGAVLTRCAITTTPSTLINRP